MEPMQVGNMGLPADPERAAELYRLAASKGDAAGYLNLGVCYLHGRGVSTDQVVGAEYVTTAAEMVCACMCTHVLSIHVCMYVYVYTYIHTHAYIDKGLQTCMHTNIHEYRNIHTGVHTYRSTCMSTYMSTYIQKCRSAYI